MISFSSKITQKVLSYFLLNPDAELYLNEMARKFCVDRPNLSRKLAEWEGEGVLSKRQLGNLSLYKINRKYPLLSELKSTVKKSFGLEMELKKMLEKIKGIKEAVIFGSYAQDKMEMESDIDILLVGSHNFFETQKVIVSLQKKLDREINVIDMTEKEFVKAKKQELVKNIFSNKYIKII
jgi:predicted nucleotidyltransferase